jgi:hypothetical protein
VRDPPSFSKGRKEEWIAAAQARGERQIGPRGGTCDLVCVCGRGHFRFLATTTTALARSMASTIVFPAHTTDQIESMSSVSVLSRQATALEICDMVYGNKTPSWEAIEHFYEPSASESFCFDPSLFFFWFG